MNRIIDPLWRPGGVFKFPLSFVVFSYSLSVTFFFKLKLNICSITPPKKTQKKKNAALRP
jgi:hypothetical protein